MVCHIDLKLFIVLMPTAGGYLFNYDRRVRVNGEVASLFRCAKRSNGCPAEILLDGKAYLKESLAEHTHFGNPFEISQARVYAQAKAMIRLDPKRGVDSIITAVLTNCSDAVQRRVKRKNLERALYRLKDKILNHPKGPTTPAELVIPEEWSIHPDGEPYVLGDILLSRTARASAERIILFSHPRSLQILSESPVVAGDGTFAMRFPPQSKWRQLYMIHGYVGKTFIPLVGIASNSSTARMYASALQYVKDYMHDTLNLDWQPKVFLSDFEAAIISALPRVFAHEGFIHKGCWFHHSQAIMKRVKSLGLQKDYSSDTYLKIYVDKLRYLALVPFFSIGRCLATLTDGRDAAELFRKYPALHQLVFDYYLPVSLSFYPIYLSIYYSSARNLQTWVGANRKAAIFSPSLWNHGRVDEMPEDFDPDDPQPVVLAEGQLDHPMTDNAVESSHRTLNAIGRKHGKKFWHIWIDVREFLGTITLSET
jgi:hypothetical protein